MYILSSKDNEIKKILLLNAKPVRDATVIKISKILVSKQDHKSQWVNMGWGKFPRLHPR